MKVLLFILLSISLLLTKSAESPYLIISDSIVSKYISDNPTFFLFLHNPWCKWSQKFQSAVKKANSNLIVQDGTLLLGEYDVTINNEFLSTLQTSLNSHKYPRLLFFKKGVFIQEFNGVRNHQAVFHFLISNLHPGIIKVTSEKHFSNLVENLPSSIVSLAATIKTSLDIEADFETLLTSNKAVFIEAPESFENTSNEIVRFYLNGQQVDSLKRLEYSLEKLKNVIDTHLDNRFHAKFTEQAIHDIFIQGQPAFFLFRNKWDESTKVIEEQLPYLTTFEVRL